MTYPIRTLLPAALLIASSAALAHETWLLPKETQPEAPGEITLSLASGMHFGGDGAGIAPDRIARARVHHAEGTAELAVIAEDVTETTLRAPLEAGLNCAEVVLNPRFLTLDPSKIDLYFDEIGASEAMRESWAASANPELWRETYTKYAKTIVRVDGAGDDAPGRCWQEGFDHALEFMPMSDPTALAPGDTLRVEVRLNGAAAAGQTVGLALANGGHQPLATADGEGRVEFPIDAPGTYMVYATNLRRSDREGEDWTSDFATLVFTVPEATMR